MLISDFNNDGGENNLAEDRTISRAANQDLPFYSTYNLSDDIYVDLRAWETEQMSYGS